MAHRLSESLAFIRGFQSRQWLSRLKAIVKWSYRVSCPWAVFSSDYHCVCYEDQYYVEFYVSYYCELWRVK